ncbi:hypothetical protein F7725_004605 [Dissostichus mawsoni]|uniref:RING-type domain-containing protein n=1 Tax=Dissostichus mawsoni TaxID=36200 RepID=A0A7J5XJM2_DISMA|nr:hypothetical protein F7725_004605 [Dissostichus mawsoni]
MTAQQQKRYVRSDTTLKFVNGPDVLDYLLRGSDKDICAEMSCGHAVTPQTLTEECQRQLYKGKFKFKCPASKDDTKQTCDKEWSYQEVCKMALLTAEEKVYFEENMARLAATANCEFGACPGCQTYLVRTAPTNLSVRCTICTKDKKKVYKFCWQCLKEWKGTCPRSDRCDNDGCTNPELELLKTCKTTALSRVQGVTACPSIRACPTCGQRVQHDTTGCKNIICPRCKVEFCFVCLKLTRECMKTSSYFIPCSAGVAPRQTSIPEWHSK